MIKFYMTCSTIFIVLAVLQLIVGEATNALINVVLSILYLLLMNVEQLKEYLNKER